MPTFLDLNEVKAYLQISHSDDDAMLAQLIDAAEHYIADPYDGILGRPVSVQSFTEKFSSFSDVALAFPDNAAIASVTYIDVDNATQTLGDIYTLDGEKICLNSGETWPSANAPITVQYSAGYAVVPAQIKAAAHYYIAVMFDQRHTVDPKRLREVIAAMLAGYRRVGL